MDNQQPKFKKNAQKYFLKPNTIYGNWKTIEQVKTCCPICNYMKHTLTQEGFYRQLVKIVNHLKLGSTTISEESTLQANGSGNGENPKKD